MKLDEYTVCEMEEVNFISKRQNDGGNPESYSCEMSQSETPKRNRDKNGSSSKRCTI